MKIRGSVRSGAIALALLVTGCSGSDGSSPATDATPEPSPTPTEFEQSFADTVIGEAATVTATVDRLGPGLTPDNIGVSFEATDLADPRLDPANSNLDEQLKSLGSPALRFGGNALDRRTFWTSKGEEPKHDEKVTVTPDDLKRLKKLVDATGSTVTLGIPLGTYDPDRGADMAAHAVDILGDSLVGLAIGNEPNGYTVKDVPDGAVRGKGWNKDKYVQQLEAYAKAIHTKVPEAPIIGPDVYDGAWMKAFSDSDVKKKDRDLAALVSALRMRFFDGARSRPAGGEPHRPVGEKGGEEEPRHREGQGRRGRSCRCGWRRPDRRAARGRMTRR